MQRPQARCPLNLQKPGQEVPIDKYPGQTKIHQQWEAEKERLNVNYMIFMGINYILLDGQLVLSYTYISNQVQLLNNYERSNVKVTSIEYYQIIKVIATMVLKYKGFTCPTNRKLIN